MPSGPGYNIDCPKQQAGKLNVTGAGEKWDVKKITLSDGCVVDDFV